MVPMTFGGVKYDHLVKTEFDWFLPCKGNSFVINNLWSDTLRLCILCMCVVPPKTLTQWF